jgi:hypothetical protein
LETDGLTAIEPLLDRAVMVETVRTGVLGALPRSLETYYEIALAVLLADEGPSRELDAVQGSLKRRSSEVESWPAQRDKLLAWVAHRLTKA